MICSRTPSCLSLAPAIVVLMALACEQAPTSAGPSESSAPKAPSGAVVEPAPPAVSAAPPLRWTEAAPEVTPPLQAIAGSILVGGRSYAFLRELTDGYGPRLTGSPVYAGAARWAAETFRTMGVDDVRLEEFDLAAGWERGPVTLRAVEPSARPLAAQERGWSPTLPGGALTAELVVLDDLSEAKAKGRALAGKAVLVGRHSGPRAFAARQQALRALKASGAVAVLVRGRRPNNVGTARQCFDCASVDVALPTLEVGLEDVAWLERRLGEGKVTIHLTSASRRTGPVKVPNVVAEVRGREKPDEYVLVGAHLDAWDFATGAQDNGAGVAQVLEAARATIAAGVRPRRSLRFALWGGEEQALYGSRAYVKAHVGELDRVVAALNADFGAGAPRGWSFNGRQDLIASFDPLAKRLFAGLGATELKDDFNCSSDHCPFALEGVPTLNFEVDRKAYEEVHHTPGDTIDKVRESELAAGAACVATAAYALADLPQRFGARLPRARVTADLKARGEFDDLVGNGFYTP